MRASKTAAEKYKKVCDDFPYLNILTKSATPGKFQLTFAHATIGDTYHGESIVSFALAVNIDSSSVIYINMDMDFVADGDKIRLPITEVLLRNAASDLVRSKNQQD